MTSKRKRPGSKAPFRDVARGLKLLDKMKKKDAKKKKKHAPEKVLNGALNTISKASLTDSISWDVDRAIDAIEEGANPDRRGRDGLNTLLHYICQKISALSLYQSGNDDRLIADIGLATEQTRRIIALGAHTDILNANGETAPDIVKKVLKSLVENSPNNTGQWAALNCLLATLKEESLTTTAQPKRSPQPA